MADKHSAADSGEPTTRTQEEINRLTTHARFRWLNEDAQKYPLAEFVEQVQDIASGIALALEIVEMSDIQRGEAWSTDDESIVPAIQLRDAFTLRRFTIAASRMLAERSENLCDWLNQYGAKAVREGGV